MREYTSLKNDVIFNLTYKLNVIFQEIQFLFLILRKTFLFDLVVLNYFLVNNEIKFDISVLKLSYAIYKDNMAKL